MSLFSSELATIRYPSVYVKCKDSCLEKKNKKKTKQWGGNLNFSQNYRSKHSVFIKLISFKGPLVMVSILVPHTTPPVGEVRSSGCRKGIKATQCSLGTLWAVHFAAGEGICSFMAAFYCFQSSCCSALQFGGEGKGWRWSRARGKPSGEPWIEPGKGHCPWMALAAV